MPSRDSFLAKKATHSLCSSEAWEYEIKTDGAISSVADEMIGNTLSGSDWVRSDAPLVSLAFSLVTTRDELVRDEYFLCFFLFSFIAIKLIASLNCQRPRYNTTGQCVSPSTKCRRWWRSAWAEQCVAMKTMFGCCRRYSPKMRMIYSYQIPAIPICLK